MIVLHKVCVVGMFLVGSIGLALSHSKPAHPNVPFCTPAQSQQANPPCIRPAPAVPTVPLKSGEDTEEQDHHNGN